MAKKKRSPSNPAPEDSVPRNLLHFVETQQFSKNWKSLGLNDEDHLSELQFEIMTNPKGAPVVRHTGGLRKLRFAPAAWHTGQSGALRVCYVYIERFGTVLLLTVYDKHAKDDLSASECKTIRRLISAAEFELERRGEMS